MNKEHGIPLLDPYEIQRNFQSHRKNFRAIVTRRRPKSKTPSRAQSNISHGQPYYKPFLNYSSNIVSHKYFYNPSLPQASLRIYNENREIANRLQRIHLKSRPNKSPRQLMSRTMFTQNLKQRKLREENQNLAQRILQTNNYIDMQQYQKQFQSHQQYSKLRRATRNCISFATLTTQRKNKVYQFGSGNFLAKIQLKQFHPRGSVPSLDQDISLTLKPCMEREATRLLFTYKQLSATIFHFHLRRKQLLRKKGARLKFAVSELRGTEEVEVGRFVISVFYEDVKEKGEWREYQQRMSKSSGSEGGYVEYGIEVQGQRGQDGSMHEREDEDLESSGEQAE